MKTLIKFLPLIIGIPIGVSCACLAAIGQLAGNPYYSERDFIFNSTFNVLFYGGLAALFVWSIIRFIRWLDRSKKKRNTKPLPPTQTDHVHYP